MDLAAMAAAQAACLGLKKMRVSPALKIIMKLIGDNRLLGDVPTGVFRPFVLAASALHSVHHPGVQSMRFDCQSDILLTAHGSFSRSCLGCQRMGKYDNRQEYSLA